MCCIFLVNVCPGYRLTYFKQLTQDTTRVQHPPPPGWVTAAGAGWMDEVVCGLVLSRHRLGDGSVDLFYYSSSAMQQSLVFWLC